MGSMSWEQEYHGRLVSFQEAAALIQPGDILYTPIGGDARSFANRRIALNKVGPRMDFDQSYGGVAVLTALQESRFMDRKDNRGYQSELLEPQHDKFSHRRSAVEFWAVLMTNEEAMATHVTGMESAAPMRISMSGKRIA